MKSFRGIPSLLPALFALCALMPPSGWTLCIGSQGHLAVEPAAIDGTSCCDSPSGLSAGVTRPSDACDPCEDVRLSTGPALIAKSESGLSAPASTAWIASAARPVIAPPAQIGSAHPAGAASPPRSAPRRTPILRC